MGTISGVYTRATPGFRDPEAWGFRRDRVLRVRQGDSAPVVANIGKRFTGWCDSPGARPLVLLSGGTAADPAGWKPFRPATAFRDTLLRSFIRAVGGSAPTCGKNGKVISFRVTAADMIVERAYRNAAGERIVSVHLPSAKNTCDGVPSEEWLTHSFVMGTSTVYLGPGFELVDAGDYDGDGRSEVLFWSSHHHEDGYTLFYDDFQHRVDYHWSYH